MSIELIQINDTFVVQFPKREFVLGDRASALTIAQYYAGQHGVPVVENGTAIYSPPTRDGHAVLSQGEIERNRAHAEASGIVQAIAAAAGK